MQSKAWYASRTLWFNLFAILVVVAQAFGARDTLVIAPGAAWMTIVCIALATLAVQCTTRQPQHSDSAVRGLPCARVLSPLCGTLHRRPLFWPWRRAISTQACVERRTLTNAQRARAPGASCPETRPCDRHVSAPSDAADVQSGSATRMPTRTTHGARRLPHVRPDTRAS